MSDDPIRYCRSYNMQGQRCEHPGGHPGDHAIIITWTDEEEWSPTMGALPTITPREYAALEQPFVPVQHPVLSAVPDPVPLPDEDPDTLGPVPIYGQDRPGMCVLCNHRMHNGECQRGACDCKTGIPG